MALFSPCDSRDYLKEGPIDRLVLFISNVLAVLPRLLKNLALAPAVDPRCDIFIELLMEVLFHMEASGLKNLPPLRVFCILL